MIFFNQFQKKNTHSARTRGFTLLELLVTIGIFILMTSLLLANQRRFSNTLELSNLAYDVSLTIRQAQTYGFGVKVVGAANFDNYYGVHFDRATPTKFIVFSAGIKTDKSIDPYVANAATDKTYTLKSGYTITGFCSIPTGQTTCDSVNTTISKIDVAYQRPNPDAIIKFYNAAGQSVTSDASHIRITLQAPSGKQKYIDVYKSGQIAVVDPVN
jgi:prepilin-type N-terminal cleavage/methylation domain-containing protein